MSTEPPLTPRRDFLGSFATGIGGVALAGLLSRDGLLAGARESHYAPRARRLIHVFLQGGLSHLDSWDHKPRLAKLHGKAMPEEGEKPDVFGKKIGAIHRPFWEFKQCGQSGLWGSALFPHLREHMDELAFIKSMTAPSGNHTPATYIANCGFNELAFPCMGSWISYGLGSENRDVPGFVVLGDPRGLPSGGPNLWGAGFLPGQHQGVRFQSSDNPINFLNSPRKISEATRRARYRMLEEMNRRHLAERGSDSDPLRARLASYELAARMQLAIPGVVELAEETEQTQALYGMEQDETKDFGRMCLLARRMVERGVRVVQLWSGATLAQPTWDSHGELAKDHWREAVRIDRPLAGLLTDLRQRGLLDETLVVFSTEFGRTPFTEIEGGKLGSGRDHSQDGFTNWFAGGGVKGGSEYGATDSLGFRTRENPVSVHDFHATILHLLGIDHTALTYLHNGFERRLTNVHGHVIDEILA
ncbi:MAG: hypothetical protein CMP28_05405 [Roseibacillus sp.]|nr:hypothetical protein [Roseibacillus sp.]